MQLLHIGNDIEEKVGESDLAKRNQQLRKVGGVQDSKGSASSAV